MIHDTQINSPPHIGEHTLEHTERTYTAQEIADQHNVKSVTVRTRWFEWLLKVAPEPLLRIDKSYTPLAYALFGEFALVDKAERHAWVKDAKQRYARDWDDVGVIDCEVMPDNVGGTLALLQTNLSLANQSLKANLSEVSDFISQLNAVEANCSQAEIESWQSAGALKAVAQFKTEESARVQTLNALRQQRMGGQS